jgi:hypothetical protein
MRQTTEGKSRLIVHLYNDLNTTAHHALPTDDVPLREESVPIADIGVLFDRSYRLSAARLQPDGTELPLQVDTSGTEVRVPRLDIHAMVVAELIDSPQEGK